MIHKLRYECVFCRKPGEVEYDDSNPLSEDQVAFWLKHVACDPCAVYHRTTRDSIRAIHGICNKWAAVKDSSTDCLELRAKVRKQLAMWLNKLAVAVANFRHGANQFDPRHVETIIDEPTRMSGVIRELTGFKA
jgi:hypothetical protein